MKITNLELFIIGERSTLLKVSTDEGVTGWGEPVLEGRVETVVAAVREMAEWLVGFVDGYVELPQAPGLGLQINEEAVREAAAQTRWRVPLCRAHDGSVAEW